MSQWIDGYQAQRLVHFECDRCNTCRDHIDPEWDYPPINCTRHELHTLKICFACDHDPCRCEEIRNHHKYPWERNRG